MAIISAPKRMWLIVFGLMIAMVANIFFESNMTKDNWQNIGTFKSQRTMLLFQKAHRWCVMNITDESFNTHVEIWVAPTTGGAQSGLLK